MSRHSGFPAPATMAARLGSDLLLSLGIATAAALLVMAPTLISEAAPGRAEAPTLTLLRDGKIGDRIADTGWAGEENSVAGRPLMPAALAMPMSLAWPEEGAWAPPRAVAGTKAHAAVSTATLPPRRLAALSEKKGQAMAAPLMILPPAAMAGVDAEKASGGEGADSALRQFAVAPAMKVVDAVSGAAGSVQAAGSWTLTQANGLLPRW